jgi:hypothetical protein
VSAPRFFNGFALLQNGPALGFRVTIKMLGYDSLIDPDTGHYLSEDYAFCRRWLDTQGDLTHIWPHEFAGRPRLRREISPASS